MLYLCIGRGQWSDGDGNLVACVLSWPCWRPLSQLSFGAYLIHPIVVFVWQLGDREKQVFRLITFGMDYISVCVVSFVAALFASVLVECPCALLLKKLLQQGPENLKLSNDVLAITEMESTLKTRMIVARQILHPFQFLHRRRRTRIMVV